MLIFDAQHLVDDVAVVGKQNQAFGIFVEPTNREDPFGVINEIDDVALHRALGGAGDAHRLVERNVDWLAEFACRANYVAVDADPIARCDLCA